MPEFAKLQNTSPVLEGTNVGSSASGRDRMAEIFGQVRNVATATAFKMEKEHSDSMMMNATAQSNAIVSNAQIKMVQNPAQAEEIQKGVEKDLQTVGDSPLNSGDRQRLSYINSMNFNKVRMEAAKIGAKQSRLEAGTTFWDAYNNNMQLHSSAVNSMNLEQADSVSKNILANAKNAVIGGVITPQSYENINKALVAQDHRLAELHSLLQSDDATAKDLHTASLDIFAPHDLNTAELPANHGTELLSNHYRGTMTQEDIDKDIINWNMSKETIGGIANQTNAEFTKTAQKILGAREAHGLLNSNPAYPQIENKINTLEAKSILSSKEEAELKVYQGYVKELNHGSFWQVQSRGALGARAINEWNSERAIAEKHISYGLTAQDQARSRERSLAEADNNFIDKGVSISESSHIDPRLARPIPENIVAPVQSAFNLDGDPNQALAQISRLKMRNRGYLGNQMKEGRQKEVITAVSFGIDNNMTDTFAKNYITANQSNRDFSALKTEDTQRDSAMRAEIANNASDIISYFSAAGGGESATRINDFVNSGLNYIKLRAMQSGDMTIDNMSDYADEFTQEMKTAYNIKSRRFGYINNSQTQMSDAQQDLLQNYVYHEAQKNFMGNHENDINFQAGLSKTDITVYIDSTNHVIAKDSNGTPLFYAPYNDHLMASAKHHFKPTKITEDKKNELSKMIQERAPFYSSRYGAD